VSIYYNGLHNYKIIFKLLLLNYYCPWFNKVPL